jgi:hypothetical protein
MEHSILLHKPISYKRLFLKTGNFNLIRDEVCGLQTRPSPYALTFAVYKKHTKLTQSAQMIPELSIFYTVQ